MSPARRHSDHRASSPHEFFTERFRLGSGILAASNLFPP